MDIVSGLAAAAQALEIAKQLREFDKSFSDAEFKLKIADLYTALSDTKMALADAREAIQERDAEIRRLKEVQSGKLPIVRKDGFSFGIENGKVNRTPFCPTCEQAGRQLQFSVIHGDTMYCSTCKRVEQRIPAPPPLPTDAGSGA
jgi:hypothetical protein